MGVLRISVAATAFRTPTHAMARKSVEGGNPRQRFRAGFRDVVEALSTWLRTREGALPLLVLLRLCSTSRDWRRGVLSETVEIRVRYVDADGGRHEVRTDFYGQMPADGRIRVRYAKHRPQDGRLEGFWPVWGLWSFAAGALLLFAGLMKVALAARGLDWDGRPKDGPK